MSFRREVRSLAVGLLVGLVGSSAFAQVPRASGEPERRALAFLSREVPQWQRENHCFSCHNNGDGARVLFDSLNSPIAPSADSLAETLDFLSRPERWRTNGVDAVFSDKRLARLQFASALAAADGAGRIIDRRALVRAADLLTVDQAEDGCWPIDEAAAVGSPTTYGPPLATAVAVRTLRQADAKRFRDSISRAEGWFRRRPIENVHDASAILLAIIGDTASDRMRIDDALDFLARAQNDDGGWGPFRRSASEPFDTALAIIAAARYWDRSDVRRGLRRGRDYLVANQKENGSWPETTRPPGGESYAQRVSTASWATAALLATSPWGLNGHAPPGS
jgi:Squalene-hopene cyclase C-terminal domain